jgi:hypothetical protein
MHMVIRIPHHQGHLSHFGTLSERAWRTFAFSLALMGAKPLIPWELSSESMILDSVEAYILDTLPKIWSAMPRDASSSASAGETMSRLNASTLSYVCVGPSDTASCARDRGGGRRR